MFFLERILVNVTSIIPALSWIGFALQNFSRISDLNCLDSQLVLVFPVEKGDGHDTQEFDPS